jgi:hypothetical protein
MSDNRKQLFNPDGSPVLIMGFRVYKDGGPDTEAAEALFSMKFGPPEGVGLAPQMWPRLRKPHPES